MSGRTVFVILSAIFGSLLDLPVATVWAQIQTGFVGLILQAVIVPFIVMGLAVIIKKEKKSE